MHVQQLRLWNLTTWGGEIKTTVRVQEQQKFVIALVTIDGITDFKQIPIQLLLKWYLAGMQYTTLP